jgi:MarR family transcriptional regulator, organic hydroperoxide resistance regulator
VKNPALLSGRQEAELIQRHWREAVPNDRLAHLVKDATRALVRALQERLDLHGIAWGHWTFLRILWVHDGLTQRELSLEAGVMEPTTLTAVRAMQAAGLIERRQLPGNKKNVHIYLTAQGRALETVLVPLALDVNRLAVQGVSKADIDTTRKVLLSVIENLVVAQ